MTRRVERVLLASSPYERFTLEEAGQLGEVFLREFLSLSMQQPPRISQVSSGAEALHTLGGSEGFDLVIMGTQIGDMPYRELAASIKEQWPELPVVLLGYDAREILQLVGGGELPFDHLFLWQGDVRILTAIVKLVEDQLNLQHDVQECGVQILLLVEDSVRFYSAYLPMLYAEVARHTGDVSAKGANLSLRALRLRTRPKLVHCTSYEGAWEILTGYRDSILGVVCDVEFPRDGEIDRDAGLDLLEGARELRPFLPMLLQSSVSSNAQRAAGVGASFLLKGSPTLLKDLRSFMVGDLGLGEFRFLGLDGVEVARADSVEQLARRVRTVPAETLRWHGDRHHFSNWLMARAEFELARAVRRIDAMDIERDEDLRMALLTPFERHLSRRRRSIVADFKASTFDPRDGFARIGGGSLGGKARGLAFFRYLLSQDPIGEDLDDVRVRVPSAVVLGTDVFDAFLRENWLAQEALSTEGGDDLVEPFVEAPFPEQIRDQLRDLLRLMRGPLAVRSSSLLEDLQHQPFAGIYDTFMLPNDDPSIEERLDTLCDAIKRVYASTFSPSAKAYIRATPYRLEEEKMAVIIMKVVGATHGSRFYPDLSGVVRCHNFYPTPPQKAEDGIAAVALGLGKGVVHGGGVVRFSPRYPRHTARFSTPEEWLENSQRSFWAIPLRSDRDDSTQDEDEDEEEASWLREREFELEVAEEDGTLAALASTYSPANRAVYDGVGREGVRLVSFASILKHGSFPLAQILGELSSLGRGGLNAPVEIEFAVNLDRDRDREQPAELCVLQCRPLAMSKPHEDLDIADVPEERKLLYSSNVLGNGRVEVHDVVVVDFHRFDRGASSEVAIDVGQFDAQLRREDRRYLLIGVGRWGSRDRWLGIPVTWDQIAGAAAIVEAGFRDFRVTPSQGSHFFQNLSALSIGYFTVNPELGEGDVDWSWLAEQPALGQSKMVRHLRFERPVVVLMDGRTGEGLVLKPGEESAEP